jgi:phospholipid/cholesterol/gamma-HCH transport system permease protein
MYKKISEKRKADLSLAEIRFDAQTKTVVLSGEWSWVAIDEKILSIVDSISKQNVVVDAREIKSIDNTGVYFLNRLIDILEKNKNQLKQMLLLPEDQKLFNLSQQLKQSAAKSGVEAEELTWVEKTFDDLVHVWHTALQLISFFGQLCYTFVTLFKKEYTLYVQGILDTISRAGIGGVLICAMLCFLLGVNLTYQMAPQFVMYGANVYVVNFLGIAMLREVTPLITAIIVAGRTGSAIAAQIGTMKVQEEIDALQTMGISPMRRLVAPQVIGLIIALPILTMLSDAASMLGGMLFANPLLGVDYSLFIMRLQSYVSINNFWVGIVKSFFFAGIIGMVGCFCGFRVKSNADSVGIQTTRSVVISICLIIVVDALFAILFKAMGV